MKSHFVWFVGLLIVCVAGPHLFHVEPKTRRQWQYIAVTIAFLAWLLALMAPLRSA